jgi:hypothetical protein
MIVDNIYKEKVFSMKKLSVLMMLALTLGGSVHNAQANVPMSGAANLLLGICCPPYGIYLLGCALNDTVTEIYEGIHNLSPYTKNSLKLTALTGVIGACCSEKPIVGALIGSAVTGAICATIGAGATCKNYFYRIDNQILRAIRSNNLALVKTLFDQLLQRAATNMISEREIYDCFYYARNAANELAEITVKREMLSLIELFKEQYELPRSKVSALSRQNLSQEMVEKINNATTTIELNDLMEEYRREQAFAQRKTYLMQKYSQGPYWWPQEVLQKFAHAATDDEITHIINNWWHELSNKARKEHIEAHWVELIDYSARR